MPADQLTRVASSGSSNLNGTLSNIKKPRGEVLHKPLQPFFKAVNDKPLLITKYIWGITPVLQAVGLVNERVGKLAKAVYGVCWSVVYSCYRPWAHGRRSLPEQNENKKTPEGYKTVYDLNEHFRLVMGSAVSAVYGGGALGMLYSWLRGDDELFDSSANVYKTGMLNQNQIFDSMNYAEILKRDFTDPDELYEYERNKTNAKANIEKVDSVLLIPNIVIRAMDTFRLFGKEFGENTQRVINTLSYVGYGTWAARFGILKQTEDKTEDKKMERGGGLLDEINPKLHGTALKAEELLHATQKYSGRVFCSLLPGLSWLSAGAEMVGLREVAEQTFKLEGILERLNPAISSWCIRSTWLKLFEKGTPTTQETPEQIQDKEDANKSLTQEIKQDTSVKELTPTETFLNLLKETDVNWDEVFRITKENNLWEEFIRAAHNGYVSINILHKYSDQFPDPKETNKDYWDLALEEASLSGGYSNMI